MAVAALLIRLGVDSSNVKSGADVAVRELDRIKQSATGLAGSLTAAFPKTVTSEAKNIAGAVGSLAGAFGGLGGIIATLGVGAVVNDFLDVTGSLSDLSSQTDIAIKDLQRFKFAGEQVGVSLDSITGAVGQLQNRLGSMDRSALAGLDALGLTLRDIQRLDPGQQFETIASAIAQIPDPSRRAAIAMDLFGRSGVQLLPLLRSNLKEVGDQASVLADKTVQAGDKFGDLLGRITNFGKAVIGESLLGPIVRWADETQAAIEDVGRSFDTLRGKAEELPKVLAKPLSGKGFEGPKLSFEEAIKVSEELDRKLEQQFLKRQERERRGAEERRRIEQDNARLIAEDLVDAYEETRLALQAYYDMVLLANTGIKSGVDDLSFRKNVELATVTSLTDQWAAYRDTIQSVNDQIRIGVDSAPGLSIDAKVLGGQWSETGKKAGKDFGVEFGRELARSIQGAIQGGGNIGAAIGSTIGGSIGEKAGASLSKKIGGAIGGIAGSFLGPIGAAAGAWLGGKIGDAFASKGRDMVKQFAESMGGFDSLQKKLADTFDPATAHRYWTALTQGVGKNNPEQAKAIIDEISGALAKQKAIVEEIAPSFNDVASAAAAFGIEVTSIGDAINQMKVTETATDWVKSWRTLEKAGADMSEVAKGAADEFQTLVIESLKWGHALPESIRPILEKMKDMGLLTDDAGEKLTDLDKLKWDEPLQESIGGLKESIKELAAVIRDDLGSAFGGLSVPALNLAGGGSSPASDAALAFSPAPSSQRTGNVNVYVDGDVVETAMDTRFQYRRVSAA